MKGQLSNGKQYTVIGEKRLNQKGKNADKLFPAKQCRAIQTGGLVYL
ncbi:MAG: hypothetical protein LUC21_03965 [Oscillospiraceae bacterium]|nr:hypothetical protein [Oscillospiraceae bacterium]MCD8389304.1 hypothetical protein [Oscillospiraceae bacterium]